MRFKNIITKKENIEYAPGDVLIVYNETLCEEEVYMVISWYAVYYNLINLNSGATLFYDFEFYDDFVKKLEKIFIQIDTVDNDELELVGVED